MEMMQVMRRQNEERAEEFKRAREGECKSEGLEGRVQKRGLRRESAEARARMEEYARVQERLQRKNEELQRQIEGQIIEGQR